MEKMIAALGLLIFVIVFFKIMQDIKNSLIDTEEIEPPTTNSQITDTVTVEKINVEETPVTVKKPRKPRTTRNSKDAGQK